MPAHWAGDERSTFGAFQRSLKAGLNASLSGVTFWGWDFAGFNGEIPTSELYLRATAMAVFTPIMQYHAESKAQFNQDRTPWNIQERTGDERVIPIFKRFADLRMNLLPYIYDEANKAVKQSLPLMRALLLDYQDDSQARECFDEYLFGSALLVAPVIQEGASGRDVYLPKGRWCNFWTGVLISGQQKLTAVPTELDEIQVYMRQDTAVLLNTADGELMSDVGNQLDSYRQPELRVFVIAGFTQVIHDYLGNRVLVEATIQADQAKVHVVSTVVGLKVKTYCAEGVSCTAVVDMEE
jgi:alpha-glucosidase (family GH31 glycosyl hydrolase)